MWISSRELTVVGLVFLVLVGTGCVEHSLTEAMRLKKEPDVIALPPNEPLEGAVWRGGTASGSFLYYDRKARGLGDLVTVVLVESLSAEGTANTTLSKDSSISAQLSSDIGVTDMVQVAARKLLDAIGVVFTGTPLTSGQNMNVITSDNQTDFLGDGETSRSSKFNGIVTCQIVDVMPGGILRLRGTRKIVVNHESQLVSIEGIARRADISIDNRIASSQLANAKLTFDGLGVLDDKQRVPLVARVMDWLYPF